MKCSAGSSVSLCGGERQRANAPITPTLVTALTQKGAAIPTAAAIAPPNAGPTARLMFTPTLFMAIAGGKSLRGTSIGTTACQAGEAAATQDSITKVNSNSVQGVASSSHTQKAKPN